MTSLVLGTKMTFLPDIEVGPLIIVLPRLVKVELGHQLHHLLPSCIQDVTPVLIELRGTPKDIQQHLI